MASSTEDQGGREDEWRMYFRDTLSHNGWVGGYEELGRERGKGVLGEESRGWRTWQRPPLGVKRSGEVGTKS